MGSALTLAATVFVIPHLESIAGFLVLSLCVLAVGAWVAAGSARISYAGLQIAFAYALAMFENYHPSINLTEIRDRLIGIMVGLIVSTVVHGVIWPERDSVSLRGALGKMMDALAGLVGAIRADVTPDEKQKEIGKTLANCWSTINACRDIQTRVVLEPDWTYTTEALQSSATRILAGAQEAIVAAGNIYVQSNEALPADSPVAAAVAAFLEQTQGTLRAFSAGLEGDAGTGTVVSLPDMGPLETACAAAECGELKQAANSLLAALETLRPRTSTDGAVAESRGRDENAAPSPAVGKLPADAT